MRGWAIAWLVVGCGGTPPRPEAPLRADPTLLSPAEHAIRASMALRGTRPTPAELRWVRHHPERLPALVEDWLADDARFGETVRDLENQTLLMRAEHWPFPGTEVAGRTPFEVNRSVFEAPLRLIEHVVLEDRPYTEIVTADYVVADAIVAGAWDAIAPWDPSGPEWQPLRYTDGRPAAGILVSEALWYRYRSATNNHNRGRANAVSRALLCHDYLAHDVVIDEPVDLVDTALVSDLVATRDDCRSCHVTLDPLASFFWVFPDQLPTHQPFPYASYTTADATGWQDVTGRPPALSGLPGDDLGDLGALIAADPRFAPCTARRWYAYFAQIPQQDVPVEVVEDLAGVLVSSGWSARALAKAAVLRPELARARGRDAAEAETVVGYQLVRSDQLHRMFEDLTGFTWTTEVYVAPGPAGNTHAFETEPADGLVPAAIELDRGDYLGYRVLAGGVDSYYTTQPIHTVNTTVMAWLQARSYEAASHAVHAELARPPAERRLLTRIDATTTDEPTVRAQLVDLHTALFGAFPEPHDPDIDDGVALFDGALAVSGDPARAWALVLAALFQDVRLAYY